MLIITKKNNAFLIAGETGLPGHPGLPGDKGDKGSTGSKGDKGPEFIINENASFNSSKVRALSRGGLPDTGFNSLRKLISVQCRMTPFRFQTNRAEKGERGPRGRRGKPGPIGPPGKPGTPADMGLNTWPVSSRRAVAAQIRPRTSQPRGTNWTANGFLPTTLTGYNKIINFPCQTSGVTRQKLLGKSTWLVLYS